MTISSTIRKAGPFVGNGSAIAFAFAFRVFSAADLAVVRIDVATGVETLLIIDSHYTAAINVDQNSNPGGSITLVGGALPAGQNLIITSNIANLQPTDLTNQGGFYPEVITDALDRATIQIQQLDEHDGRALVYPITDPLIGVELPALEQRKGATLAFDDDGAPYAGPLIEDLAGQAASAEAAAAAAAISADEAAASAASAASVTETYQSPSATDPTVRDSGDPLETGDQYFNTANDRMRVFETGTGWIDYEATAQAAAVSASSNATIATTQAGIATTKAGEAAASASSAASSSSAASLNSNVYPSTAAGLAATTNGQQFQVVVGLEIIRYQNTSGVAVEVARYPSAAKVSFILESAPLGYSFGVVDAFGQLALGVKTDGGTQVATLNGRDPASFLGDCSPITPQGYKFTILDANGNAAFGIKNDGTVAVAALETVLINGAAPGSSSGGAGVTYRGRFPSEINMVLSYGQSLAVGQDGVPSITLAQRFDNIRFAGGVRSQDNATPYTSFIPLVEMDSTVTANAGETPIAGATDMIKELIASEDKILYTQQSFQLLGSAPGAGGSPISGLIKGQGAYTRFMNDVTNGYTLAQAAGKSFKVGAFFWTQGESDYNVSTAKATYKAQLVQLRTDIDTDTKVITGQTEPVACISYQTAGHPSYGHANDPYIAVGQYEVARDTPNHYIACPLYWSPQTIHQSAQNYKRLGAYYGLAYKRIIVDGIAWKPTVPLQWDRQGNIITVRFNVPVKPLVLDTAFFSQRPDYGFSVVTSALAAVTISSVTITEPDTVKIVTATPAGAGGKIRYGWTSGNGGNLRDSQGGAIIFNGNGQNFPLHNWCVLFEETLA